MSPQHRQSKSAARLLPGTSTSGRRINPWRKFVGSIVPNWLQRRREVGQGVKLAYGRLMQYAGQDGDCFPKQETLAAELGVRERTANEYIRDLIKFGLIESKRPGLGMSNRYFFLAHPWMDEGQPQSVPGSNQEEHKPSGPERQDSAGQERQETSGPSKEENQLKGESEKRIIPYSPQGDLLKEQALTPYSQAEQLYAAYPKQVAKPAAIRAIRRALDKFGFDFLLERTRLYAQTCNSPTEFIPDPSKWFRQERFNDDSSTWRRGETPSYAKPAIVRPDKFASGPTKSGATI